MRIIWHNPAKTIERYSGSLGALLSTRGFAEGGGHDATYER